MFFRESGHYRTSFAADQALFPHPASRWLIAISILLFFVVPPVWFDDFYLTRFTFVGIAVISALGLNILLGLAGQISLGHGAAMSIGAYTAANLAVGLNVPFWLTVPLGGLMAALIGGMIGIPSLRIRGMYIAFATLACQKIVEWILDHVPALSGGTEGVIYMPHPQIFGFVINEPSEHYLLVLTFAVFFILLTLNIKRSRLGRAFVAIRDHELAAGFIGVNVFRYKIYAFCLCSFYAGVAGVLFSYFVGVASFQHFGLGVSITYLAIVIIGGLGSVFGTILGVAFFAVLPLGLGVILTFVKQVLFDVGNVPQAVSFLGQVVFGCLIILFLILEPEGLNKLYTRVKNYFRFWPFSH